MSRSQVVKAVVGAYDKLNAEWSKKNANLDLCGRYLSDIKVELTKLKFLPSTGSSVSKEELLVARNTLEIGALWSIVKKDIPSFERYIAMLRIYYIDYKNLLPESSYMYELLGLDLLCLLAQNKVGEFHTALEHLPPSVVSDNIYIKHPVALEQYLMEGSYNKIFLAKGEVPAEGYKFFIGELLSTIREDIADCVENAYDKIKTEDIGKMLYFRNSQEILSYCKQRGWKVGKDGYLTFTKEDKKQDEVVPSQDLASHMINYAREMEQIV